ncbi:MerR HTH family regulatory protein (plasmid) [Caballeronia sp. SBC1]|uniref:MerR family transcriptional regulator n=1 Tax=unclassified Caballeronia TaxID=2646786 RepID=UPI0013E1567B|nr:MULTISPECIES: MerR family transcriptional regulator [unclassified Caballeronia]QIE29455.1 MerR HTH family regulatory protein [Caballeronia sp. SBC2]QIN67115.1 MerR HTH family regulatory protein [Caballeronia sp. SBC1]
MNQVDESETPRFRSGAVARRANMPVATLRIWERRYEVAPSAKTDTGHRLYSEEDVKRIVLLKVLVNLGHAIGSIAKLNIEQLKEIAGHAEADMRGPPGLRKWNLIIIGSVPIGRLNGNGLTPPAVVFYNTLEEAQSRATSRAEALLVHIASLQEETSQEILHLAKSLKADAVTVAYGFGTTIAIEALRFAGVRLHRESLGILDIPQIVDDLFQRLHAADFQWTRAPRRFSDSSLLAIASLSPTIACECPRHLAELVMKLSDFETYSDECVSRSPADAALHRHLADVANRARSMIETALERVSRAEGLKIGDEPQENSSENQV